MTTKLRLGPLPKTESTKLTITLSAQLKRDLDRYALLHSQTWGDSIDSTALIPHMLETFMRRDRVFKKNQVTQSTPSAKTIVLDEGSGALVEAGNEL